MQGSGIFIILAAIFLGGAGLGAGPVAARGAWSEADALLGSPTLDMRQAAQALTLYQGALAAGTGPRTALLARLSRTCFLLGQMTAKPQNLEYYRQGEAHAETLLRDAPGQAAGHYWLALNRCGQAEAGGNLAGRRLLPRIMEGLKHSLTLDEAYDGGGAHRVLGRIYYEAPGWPLSVGDIQKSLQHLKAAVRLGPGISTNHLYLAQTLIRLNDVAGAVQELEQAIKSSRAAVNPRDLEDDRREARRLLVEIRGGEDR